MTPFETKPFSLSCSRSGLLGPHQSRVVAVQQRAETVTGQFGATAIVVRSQSKAFTHR